MDAIFIDAFGALLKFLIVAAVVVLIVIVVHVSIGCYFCCSCVFILAGPEGVVTAVIFMNTVIAICGGYCYSIIADVVVNFR